MSGLGVYAIETPSDGVEFPDIQWEDSIDKIKLPEVEWEDPFITARELAEARAPMAEPPTTAVVESHEAPMYGHSGVGIWDKVKSLKEGRAQVLIGKFRTPMLILTLSAIVLFLFGLTFYALIPAFVIVGVVSRYLCLTSDIIKDMECVTTCTMLLVLITGSSVFGAIFAFLCLWITRWIHPAGGAERISYTIGDSLCMSSGALLFPHILAWQGNQILPAMFWFHIWRFSFFLIVTMPLFNKIAWGPDIACAIPGFPIAVTQAFMLLSWFGPGLLGHFGITGWTLGAVYGIGPEVVQFFG